MRSWFATRSSTGSSSDTAAASAGRALHGSAAAPTGSSNFRDSGSIDDTAKDKDYRMGGADYLTEPFAHRELLARIKAVVRRGATRRSDEPVEFGDLKLEPAAHRITAASGKISLWATEFRRLHFLMTHPDRVYSRGQLLDEVWGDHVFVEDRTVDVHIRRLRQALQPSGHEKRIETVRGAGYCFRANPG